MKRGDTGIGTVGMTSYPDRGRIVRDEGTVTVKQAIPGQEVEYRIRKTRNGNAEGRILSVVKPSPIEDEPFPCAHRMTCGGCLYQTISYGNQVKLKERQLKELLDRAAGAPYAFDGLFPSPVHEGYRNKMEYTFGDEYLGGPMALGNHKRGGRFDIVTIGECRIVHPDFNRILLAALDLFREKGIPFYQKKTQEGLLRHLVVRRGLAEGEILADLVTRTGMEESVLGEFRDRILSLPLEGRIAGILHTVNDSPADAVIDQGTEVLYGSACFTETLSGLSFRITPFSFFQSNTPGAEVLYGLVREYVGDPGGRVVFDLYSGTGTITQLVAPAAKRAVGVELVPEAVEAARLNAEANGIRNCSFIAGDVLKVLDELEERPDVIILDPPREGIHPKALPKILAYGVERLIYVSCKPSSLQRDIPSFEAAGYVMERAGGVDMFPYTPGIEAVALFTRKG